MKRTRRQRQMEKALFAKKISTGYSLDEEKGFTLVIEANNGETFKVRLNKNIANDLCCKLCVCLSDWEIYSPDFPYA